MANYLTPKGIYPTKVNGKTATELRTNLHIKNTSIKTQSIKVSQHMKIQGTKTMTAAINTHRAGILCR